MAKRYTPAEIKARGLIKRLIVLEDRLKRSSPNADTQQRMADDIKVDRVTVNRWLNWTVIPRGPSLTVIENYLDMME